MRCCLIFVLLSIGACGANRPHAELPKQPKLEVGERPSDGRTLSREALFADLVAVASVAQQTDTESNAGPCLMQSTADGDYWHVGADFASPIRPIPKAPKLDADMLRSNRDAIVLVTRWSTVGQGRPYIALTALPVGDLDRVAFVIQTEEGLWLRATHKPIPTAVSIHFDLEELPARIKTAFPHGVEAIFVTADRNRPITEVAALLWTLGKLHPHVGIALALPKGTKLPQKAQKKMNPKIRCASRSQAAEGSLAIDALKRGIAPLPEAVKRCYESTAAKTMKGGKIVVEFAIDLQGRPDACIDYDEIENNAFNTCVLSHARELRFEAPSPAGRVLVAIPFVLEAKRPKTQTPVCDFSF